jgi:hypothetical protein
MLTTAQLQAIKANVLADPTLSAMWTGGNPGQIAAYYNTTAAPDFFAWRSSVTQDEIMQNGFDWTRVDNLTVGKARIWGWLFDNQNKTINPAKANVRAGIDATWVGTAADLAVRAVVYTHCKRKTNNIEKLLATGVGSDASPATMGYEGTVDWPDINAAMES